MGIRTDGGYAQQLKCFLLDGNPVTAGFLPYAYQNRESPKYFLVNTGKL